MMQKKICDWTPSDPIQYEDKLNVIDLKSITDSLDLKEVLTALSSKKYNSKENYDRLEFLGDTILKLLSTIEVFASKISANEFELHHERARILNNYNLYRLAIKYDIYLYVLGKKPEDLPITFAKKALEEEDVN
jgi:dsRNA-specific ribonuclease